MATDLQLPPGMRSTVSLLARASAGGLISVEVAAAALQRERRDVAATLARLTRRGWLRRVRRGLYLIVPLEAPSHGPVMADDPWVMAAHLFSPCYVAGWSAAEHWGLTEQIFKSTLVVTSASVRRTNPVVLGHSFRVFRSPRTATGAGIAKVWRASEQVLVSSRERTIIDGVESPEICGGIRHLSEWCRAYGEGRDRDFERLARVAADVASGAAWKRLGYLTEVIWPAETKLLEQARRHLTTGLASLDPAVAQTGRIATRWRLRVNVDVGG